jgi:type IV secretory pathway VirB3-like protein
MAGVPTTGLVLLFLMFIMFVYLFKMYYMIAAIALLYVVMRLLTAKDPWLIDIFLDFLQQKDVFIP